MRPAAYWGVGIAFMIAVVAGGGEAEAAGARATLKDAQGKSVGTATLEETAHGVLIHLDLSAIPPGTHAFHIHAVGKCEPPFDSAGGHFNPAGKQHGMKNPAGMHAGDFPNLEVAENGKLRVSVLASDVTLGDGKQSLFDTDGSALVIHAGPDDYSTDPSGNAGARIACGVVEK